MISGRFIDNSIRISYSENQIIDMDKLRRIYRLSSKFIDQCGNKPIIVDAQKNVRFDIETRKIFERLSQKLDDLTLVIIHG